MSSTKPLLFRLEKTHREIFVDWWISDFLFLPDVTRNSPPFIFYGQEWHIRLQYYKSLVSLHLVKKPSQSTVHICLTLGAKSIDGFVLKSFDIEKVFTKDADECGENNFDIPLHLDMTIPYLSALVIFFTAYVKEGETADARELAESRIFSVDGAETLSKHFKELFLSGAESDIKINVKGKEFSAHKMVLSSRSPVFRSMLELDMKEKNNGLINITDCDAGSFNDFLIFLYCGKLDITSSKSAMDLYFISDKYYVEELKKACSDYLAQNITVDTCCSVVHLADLHNATELLDIATEFFIDNSSIIVRTPKWLCFMEEHLNLANNLLIKMADKYKT